MIEWIRVWLREHISPVWLQSPWQRWRQHRAYKKRLEELKKRDPFIYH